jgi:uncharacterized membrane protein
MKLNYTKYQIALEIIGLLLLVGIIIFVYTRWDQIPQQIPISYNAMGEIDTWGSKNIIIFLPEISILLYAFLTVSSFFPQSLNISLVSTIISSEKISDENKEAVNINKRNLSLFTKVEILTFIFFLLYYLTTSQSLPIIIPSFFVTIILVTSIFFLVRISKL